MRPFPLTGPKGRIYAYACGACHHVAGGLESTVRLRGPDIVHVEASLRDATRCCTCWECSKPIPKPARGGGSLCPACNAKQAARRAAEDAANAERREWPGYFEERAVEAIEDANAAVAQAGDDSKAWWAAREAVAAAMLAVRAASEGGGG